MLKNNCRSAECNSTSRCHSGSFSWLHIWHCSCVQLDTFQHKSSNALCLSRNASSVLMSCSSGFGSHSLRARNSSVSLFSRGCLCGPLLPAVYRPARNTGRQPRVCNLFRAAAVRRVSGCASSGVVEGGATLTHAQRYEIALLCHCASHMIP
jgi:hypothetical protein